MRSHMDRFFQLVARAAVRVWFRRVEVVGGERMPARGPVLVVASHFNGLLDPALVAATSPRLPRFLAKAALWRNPVASRLLDLAGALPIHRASEGPTGTNVPVFEACFQAFEAGQAVALFPEGVTHDEPRLARVRTGAARIALGALDRGIRGLRLVPVGLIYTAKATPRSRALVRVGPPIDLDHDLKAVAAAAVEGEPTDPRAVEQLTAEIRRRLAEAALDYEDADFALVAAHASAIALRPHGAARAWEPSLDRLERCARALVAASPRAHLAIVDAFVPYLDALALLGVSDVDVVAGDLTQAAVRWRLSRLAAILVAAPAAALGAVVNGPAVGLVWWAGRLPLSAPMRGTARLLTGLAALPASWITLRWALGKTRLREPTLLAAAAGPGGGIVALTLAERLRALRSARVSLARLREQEAVLPVLWAERTALVAAVAHGLDEVGETALLEAVSSPTDAP